jgi:hypothetical protein
MPNSKKTISVALIDEPIALRLVSALVLAWDLVPLATQGRLISDASLMQDGAPNANSLPDQILSFINAHKGGPSAKNT